MTATRVLFWTLTLLQVGVVVFFLVARQWWPAAITGIYAALYVVSEGVWT